VNAFEAISVEKYQVNAMLMRPTDESMTVSVMGFEPMTVFIKYGEDPSSLEYQTGLYTLEETEPQNLVIDGLKPDTKYYYTVYCQEAINAGLDKSTLEHFRTQRSPGQTFKFTITADSHYAEQPQFGDGRLWQNTLANVGAADPDFHVDLGDTYMANKHVWNVPGADMSTVDLLHQGQRKYFGGALASVPFFKIQGNQDGEFGYHRVSAKGQPPVALWAARARTKYFPQPNPGQAFYTGNAKAEADVGGFVENYYAWRWGDALLVTLDPYFHTPMQASEGWDWTLGKAQYEWLRDTLSENWDAKYKVVLTHNLVGGYGTSQRGGGEVAHLFEWGGYNLDGEYEFDRRRPGWGAPVHQMLLDNRVDIVFHGHDHFFARQEVDGLTYQLCPKPTEKRYAAYSTATQKGYLEGDFLPGAGHLEVEVGPAGLRVDYVKSWLPEEALTPLEGGEADHANGGVAFSYALPKPAGWRPDEALRPAGWTGPKRRAAVPLVLPPLTAAQKAALAWQPGDPSPKAGAASSSSKPALALSAPSAPAPAPAAAPVGYDGAGQAATPAALQQQLPPVPGQQARAPMPIFTVQVPEGVGAGDRFRLELAGQEVVLEVPAGLGPGDDLQFRVTEDLYAALWAEEKSQKAVTELIQASADRLASEDGSADAARAKLPVPGWDQRPSSSGGKGAGAAGQSAAGASAGTEAEYTVEVPAGLAPGDSFQVDLGGQRLELTVPEGLSGGQALTFTAPAAAEAPAPAAAPQAQAPSTTAAERLAARKQEEQAKAEAEAAAAAAAGAADQQEYTVAVPDGVVPGQSFQVALDDKVIELVCPEGLHPGDLVQFQL